MNNKKLYFKVFADRKNINNAYYIDTVENVMCFCGGGSHLMDWSDSGLPPVFEPIYMTDDEFNSLPEFTGF
jgi:hypothetical protein